MSRARARCYCGRKFDPTRSLDGVSCHEHDADLTGGDQQPEDAPRRGPCCCCDPWAADETCPVHGDDEHRVVEPAPEPDEFLARIVVEDPWSTGPMGPPPF